MKHFIFALLATLSATALHAQLAFGIKAGMHNQLNQPNAITVPGQDNEFTFAVNDLRAGFQFGGYLRIGKKVFLQPEVLFNTNSTEYQINDLALGEVLKSESYQYLDFPLLGGVNVGPFSLHGGPVGHYFLSSSSELTDLDGYAQRFDQFTWGWLAGVGIGQGRVQLDLRYEGNFSRYGNHVQFFGDTYHFSNSPARFMVNLNFKLIGK